MSSSFTHMMKTNPSIGAVFVLRRDGSILFLIVAALVQSCSYSGECTFGTPFRALKLDQKFTLDFGPGTGDQFVKKIDSHKFSDMFYIPVFKLGLFDVNQIQFEHQGQLKLTNDYGDEQWIYLINNGVTTIDRLMDRLCLSFTHYYNTDAAGGKHYDHERLCEFWFYSSCDTSTSFRPSIEDEIGNYDTLACAIWWYQQTFKKYQIDLYIDEEITKKLLGEDTRYPNLAHSLFFRNLTRAADLDLVNARLGGKFKAESGFVATYYKVPNNKYAYYKQYNSIQFILACQGTLDGDAEIEQCFAIVQYSERSVENSFFFFRIDDGAGSKYDVTGPFKNMRNSDSMDKTSNVGDPGFWIYEVKQDLSKPAIRGPPKEIATFCGNGGEAIPSVIPMYIGPGKGLRLTPCLETLFPMEVSLRLVGKSFEKMIDATVEEDDFRYIKADVPELWGSNEAVSVHVISNGDDIQTPIELYFSGEQFDSNKLHITETSSEKSELRVEWPKVTLTGETDLEIREYSFSATTGYEYLSDDTVTLQPENSFFNYAFGENDAVLFLLKTEQGTHYHIVPKKHQISCEDWIARELEKDTSICKARLSADLPCPSNSAARDLDLTDASWAHEEVANGPNLWFYDPCCNQQEAYGASENELCDANQCAFNEGADFCIRSALVSCTDLSDGRIDYVSNQCCYDFDGSLIVDVDDGAGRISYQSASPQNLHQLYIDELEVQQQCCSNQLLCRKFLETRPTVIGSYTGSLTVSVKFGGHFTTFDGLEHAFLGLGVYTLLETFDSVQTEVQISTRPYGAGSVISGFAISRGETLVEFYKQVNGENPYNFVSINKKDVSSSLNDIGYVKATGIERQGVRFEMLGDSDSHFRVTIPDCGLILNVVVMGPYINLFVTIPHEFRGSLKGLLGRFDGHWFNDFEPRGVSKIISVDSDLSKLHWSFGETWLVDPRRWLFRSTLADQIKWENEGTYIDTSVYTVTEELESTYDSACESDAACIMDMVLSGGNENIPTYYKDIRSVRGAETGCFTDLYRNVTAAGVKKLSAAWLLAVVALINFITRVIVCILHAYKKHDNQYGYS